jgi:adenylosuccinate lyase
MATETLLMEAVKRGGNRAAASRTHPRSREGAARQVKELWGANDLLDRIAADDQFPFSRNEINALLDPAAFTGGVQARLLNLWKVLFSR